jgi:hypothetical protein
MSKNVTKSNKNQSVIDNNVEATVATTNENNPVVVSKKSDNQSNSSKDKTTSKVRTVRTPKYKNAKGEPSRAVLVNFDLNLANEYYAACKQRGSNASATTRWLIQNWLKSQREES